MKLGIPTLICYDRLLLAIESAECGTEKPSEYVIIDNGGTLLDTVRGLLPTNTRVIRPGTNIGVAASWNLLLDAAGDEPIVIMNDDVELGRNTFEKVAAHVRQHPIVSNGGFALFAQSPECTRRVGYYDENFWPAYYEDTDYQVRLARAGVSLSWPEGVDPIHHAGCWTTVHRLGNPEWMKDGIAASMSYFLRKWRHFPHGTSPIPMYEKPFDGKPPEGWRLRR